MTNTHDERPTDLTGRGPDDVRARGNEQPVSRAQYAAPPTEAAKVNPVGSISRSDSPPDAQKTPYPSLLGDNGAREFRNRWTEIQAAFVDEPRDAVQRADSLVAETTTRIVEIFTDHRNELERQWERGSDVTTEDLRLALQRYRSFFDRLLSM